VRRFSLEILALGHQLGVVRRLCQATETDLGGSIALGLSLRHLERLASGILIIEIIEASTVIGWEI